jgi:hypothetical protein
LYNAAYPGDKAEGEDYQEVFPEKENCAAEPIKFFCVERDGINTNNMLERLMEFLFI